VTAVAIAGLTVALAAVAAAVYFGRAALLRSDGQLAAAAMVRAAEKAEREAEEMARFEAARRRTAELATEQMARAVKAEKDRADGAEGALRDHVRSTIVGGSDDDVAALAERLLARRMPGVPDPAAPPPGSGDRTTTAPLRAPTAPGTDRPGVGPVPGVQ
jgi:hypothetical protein